MKTERSPTRFLPSMATLLLSAAAASATTENFLTPAFRGSLNSETGYWEHFSTAVGAPGNPADQPGATTGAVLTQTQPGALLTSGEANIYSFSAATVFMLADTTPFALGTAVLQTHALGSEIDYASVTLNYTDGSGNHALAPVLTGELFRRNIPGFGAGVSYFWQWDLTGLGINSYAIHFQAAESSMSFDALTLDTAGQFSAVPEPAIATFTLMGLGAMTQMLKRKREANRAKA